MKPHWELADLRWSDCTPATVDPKLLETVKTASVIEANSSDYVAYLHNVFADDPDFTEAADRWGEEEAQHGNALGRWAELVDPSFDFAAALARFRAGYRIPVDAVASVRGSRAGELVARCIVESGTCSFYSALRDATSDPLLRDICHRIAQDEAQHYRLFKRHLDRYLQREPMTGWQRLRIALGRVFETSDDELAFAYYSANVASSVRYDRERHGKAYWRRAMSFYARRHLQGAAHMVTLAVGGSGSGRLTRLLGRVLWMATRWRLRRLEADGAD